MGWAHGIVQGKEVGYGVDAVCEHPGCDKPIDRGMAYACGGWPGEFDSFCAGFFCSEHLVYVDMGDRHQQACLACAADIDANGK